MWAIAGKQGRLTSDVATSAILMWVEGWSLTLKRCIKIVDTARCRWQIHMAHTADWIREHHATRPSKNRESLCGLSSAEMVASGSGWGIGWMGETRDWWITAPLLDRQSRWGRLKHKMLAITWLTAPREETEKVRGALCALPYPVLVLWGLQWWNGGCKQQMGHRARLEDGIDLRAAFACRWGHIIPLYFLLWRLSSRNQLFCNVPKMSAFAHI